MGKRALLPERLDYAQNCLVERNRVYRTAKGSTGTDACALDFDRCCDHTTWQYNYLSENGAGILSCRGINARDFGSENNVRYNVFENCREKCVFLVSRGGPDDIYNDVFYNARFADVAVVDQSARADAAAVTIANDIFYQTVPGGKFSECRNIRYEANCHWGGSPAVAGDVHRVMTNPRFVEASKTGSAKSDPGPESFQGYKFRESSPCLHAGLPVATEQICDPWGTPVDLEQPSIGVYEPRWRSAACRR